MGFLDAFNLKREWYATSYLAIDQGPILLMIENYRSQLLWNLFMANPEIQPMLDDIGFYEQPNALEELQAESGISLFPNPSADNYWLTFSLENRTFIQIDLLSISGVTMENLLYRKQMSPGSHSLEISGEGLDPGVYMLRLLIDDNDIRIIKLIKT
jgi:hypothetical protein